MLMRRAEQVWSQVFALLGVPIIVIANDPELLATVRAAYADWLEEVPAADPAIALRLDLQSLPSTSVGYGIEVEGSRLTLTGEGIAGEADARLGKAHCTVPRRLVGDPSGLAEEVGDTLLLFLLSRTGRTPLHAAGVIVDDRLILLSGPSGSGKSTLALAASQSGLGVLSDDMIFVERAREPRFWAMPRPIHVFPQDAPAGDFPARLRGGKRKLAVPVAASNNGFLGRSLVVLIERGNAVAIERIDSAAARAGLTRLDPGFHLLADDIAAVAGEMARDGGWRLTVGPDPQEAIDLIRRRFGAEGGA